MKWKEKKVKQVQVSVPLTNEHLPLETLKQLIEDDLISDELPFDLLAEQYPSLLGEWYPGYPGHPRKMTLDDPFPVRGYIKNGTITFKGIPGLETIPFGEEGTELEEGEYEVWLKEHSDSSWLIHVVADVKEI